VTESVLSVNKVPVRLTAERWSQITEEHSELAGMKLDVLEVIVNPDRIVEGGADDPSCEQAVIPGSFPLSYAGRGYRESLEDRVPPEDVPGGPVHVAARGSVWILARPTIDAGRSTRRKATDSSVYCQHRKALLTVP